MVLKKKLIIFTLGCFVLFLCGYKYIVNTDLDNKKIRTQVLDNNISNNKDTDLKNLNEKSEMKDQMGTIIHAKDFGVKGDGSPEDAACLQRALDYTSLMKGKLIIPNGTYRSWDLIVGNNTEIEMDQYTVFDLTTAPSNTSAFKIKGEIGGKVALVKDVVLKSKQLIVKSGLETDFSIGDILKITSNEFFDIDNRTNLSKGGQKKGELVKVSSISNDGRYGIIELTTEIVDAYKVTDGVSIEKIIPKKNIHIKGGKVLGNGTTTQFGIRADYAIDMGIEDVHIENVYTVGIYLNDCMNIEIDNCNFKDILKPTLGYGVDAVNACQDIKVTNSVFNNCDHAITCGGTGEGVSNRIIFNNNTVLNDNSNAIHSHATNRYMEITNNKVYGCAGIGINYEGPSALIQGNQIYESGANGMEIRNWTIGNTKYTIINNRIIYPKGSGIRVYKVGTNNSYVQDLLINNNIIVMKDQSQSNENYWHGIRLEGVKNSIINNNTIEKADIGIFGDENCRNCIFRGNDVRKTNRNIRVAGTGHSIEQ